MRHEWYSDKRDILKWATVFMIARELKIKTILQIAMLCRDSSVPYLIEGKKQSPVYTEVYRHFRNLKDIR